MAGAAGPIVLGRAFDVTGSYEAPLVALAAVIFGTATLMLVLLPYPATAAL